MILHLDGDNVGNTIELLLLDGRLDDAVQVSERIKDAFLWMRNRLRKLDGVVRLFAGDDLIAILPDGPQYLQALEFIREGFKERSGITISGGIGTTVEQALDNLRRAKLMGGNRLINISSEICR